MRNESRKPPGEDDPTDQQVALELEDTYRLRVVTEGPAPASEADKTFDHLKALGHDALAVQDSVAEPAPAASRKVGYNPYETAPPDKPNPKK